MWSVLTVFIAGLCYSEASTGSRTQLFHGYHGLLQWSGDNPDHCLNIVSSLRMCGDILLLSPYTFMVCTRELYSTSTTLTYCLQCKKRCLSYANTLSACLSDFVSVLLSTMVLPSSGWKHKHYFVALSLTHELQLSHVTKAVQFDSLSVLSSSKFYRVVGTLLSTQPWTEQNPTINLPTCRAISWL